MADILENTHDRHRITYPSGWAMLCIFFISELELDILTIYSLYVACNIVS